MNDTGYVPCVNSTLLFADDTKLFRCIKSNFDVDQLQKDVDALVEWSKLWFLLTSQSASIYELDQVNTMLHIPLMVWK